MNDDRLTNRHPHGACPMTPLPIATMARVDDTTARLLAGTIATHDRAERAPIPADSAAMVLTVDQWRAKYGRRVAA